MNDQPGPGSPAFDRVENLVERADDVSELAESLKTGGISLVEPIVVVPVQDGYRMVGGYLWYRAVTFPRERRTARKIGYLAVASPALAGELVVRYARSDWRPARLREWRTAEPRAGVSFPALWPTRSFEDELFS